MINQYTRLTGSSDDVSSFTPFCYSISVLSANACYGARINSYVDSTKQDAGPRQGKAVV